MSGHSVFETHRVYIDAADMVQRIAAGLALDGLVTFECDPERDAVLALALRLLIPWQHRDADPDGITLICDREALARRRGYAWFGRGALEPHTELSSAPRPPALLMLFCARAASSGGAALIGGRARGCPALAGQARAPAAALAVPAATVFRE